MHFALYFFETAPPFLQSLHIIQLSLKNHSEKYQNIIENECLKTNYIFVIFKDRFSGKQ